MSIFAIHVSVLIQLRRDAELHSDHFRRMGDVLAPSFASHGLRQYFEGTFQTDINSR